MELVTLQMNARSMVEWPVATVQRGTYLHKIGCTSLLSYSSMVCTYIKLAALVFYPILQWYVVDTSIKLAALV